MHTLQPKHCKLKKEEAEALLEKYRISHAQLPKINSDDIGLPEGCQIGDIIKIERKDGDETVEYFRVVV